MTRGLQRKQYRRCDLMGVGTPENGRVSNKLNSVTRLSASSFLISCPVSGRAVLKAVLVLREGARVLQVMLALMHKNRQR